MENTIISFINQQVKYAKEKPEYAELYEHNAYGALMWEIQRTNNQDLIDVWDNRYRPVFGKIKKEYWT